ncbi:MAG: YbjN domain-containing protein [Oscillatoriales cyanobacterium RM2_1_1]|nr:YbjN domain-containing protein [Oscillatoriales cyanobacterium SM2_3_0]NJO44171.1 YbjN domain-containing protein [Oscillatoriales cyanobacterium RM2_1_1]
MVAAQHDQQVEMEASSTAEQQPLFDVLVKFLEEDGWVYKEIEHRQVLALGIEGNNGRFDCYAVAREVEQQVTIYSVFPVRVPDHKRPTISTFLMMVNYGIIIGNFELNFYDGEIRYKTSLDVEGDRLTSALTQHLIYINVTTMDKFLPGIMSVIYGSLSAEEAISRIDP